MVASAILHPRWPSPLLGGVVAVVILGGAAVFAYLARTMLDLQLPALLTTLFFSILVILAGMFPLPVTSRIKTSITTAPLFGAVLYLEPGNAVAAGLLGSVVYQLGLRWRAYGALLPAYKYLFNAGEVILSTGAAAYVFHALNGSVLNDILPALPAALAMYLVNTSLISIATSIATTSSPLRLWWRGTLSNGAAEAALYAFGVVGAMTYVHTGVLSTAIVGLPVWIMYMAFNRLASTNRQLEQVLADLREAQGDVISTSKLASVGALSLDLAHQVRNPLFIVTARLERMGESIPHDHSLRPDLERGLEGARRIQQLTDNLLAMARHQWLPTDVKVLIEDAIGLAPVDVTQKARVQRSLPDDLPKIQGNPVLLREALSNLVRNALEAASHASVRVSVSAVASDRYVTIEISDSGVGMSQAHLKLLFEPFQTLKAGGLGLGLFSAKHILDMHGGDLEVQSEEGEGTTAIVRLPVAEEPN